MERLPLYRRDELAQWGMWSRRLNEAVAHGLLVTLRPGIYTLRESWAVAVPELRVATRAHALAAASRTPPLFSHETAAALHGLPLYRPHPSKVHVIAETARPGAATGVVRHRGSVAAEERVEIDGLHCTSLTRTIADVARTAAFDQAVTITDAALRRACVSPERRYDEAVAASLLEAVGRTAGRSAHGRSRAGRVLAFADGRAELPGESVSRVRLAELGFRRIRLQVVVDAPAAGRQYRVDFGLDDADAFGEFDGRIKYHDIGMTRGRTADEIFEREKQREDWIRGTTGRRLVRWGWADIETADMLALRLAAFGIHPR